MVIRKSLRDVVLVVYFFLILISPKILFAWTTPVNISNTTGHSRYASLAVDRYGHIHVVWTDDTSGNNEIIYRFCDEDGQWCPSVNISNDSTDSDWANIIVGFSDHPHVAWTDYTSGEIFWAFNNGSSWSEPVDISNTLGPSFCPQLATDSTDKVYVVWHDRTPGDSDIYFSSYDGTSWSTPQNVTNDPLDSAYPDIAVDSKGCVHLVWMNYGADIEAYYSKYDGISWSSWVNISNLEGYSCDPKIALDSQDRPHVVWEERHGGYRVYYTHFDGENWAVSSELSTGSKNYNPTIAIDSKNIAYTIWAGKFNTDMEISWRFHNDTSWSDIAVVPDAPSRPAGPQIVIDTRDSLQVVFSGDAENNRDIFYTQRGPSGVKPQPWWPFPQGYKLEQSHPNPFNANTAISYRLSGVRPHHTTLKICNILGEEVIILVDQEQRAGRYEVVWDGRNNQGKEVTSGVYLYRLKAGEFTAARKMVLLR